MTPQLIGFLFMMGFALLVWLAFRSRFYHDACDDLKAMHDAPETKEKGFEAYKANAYYQMTVDNGKGKTDGTNP